MKLALFFIGMILMAGFGNVIADWLQPIFDVAAGFAIPAIIIGYFVAVHKIWKDHR